MVYNENSNGICISSYIHISSTVHGIAREKQNHLSSLAQNFSVLKVSFKTTLQFLFFLHEIQIMRGLSVTCLDILKQRELMEIDLKIVFLSNLLVKNDKGKNILGANIPYSPPQKNISYFYTYTRPCHLR